jgi:tetratricopeptide (TPR) repeat protein
LVNNNKPKKDTGVNNVVEMHNDASWNKKGIDAEASGNYIFAVDAFSKSIELNPDDAYGYYCRGGAYAKLNDHNKAIEDYNKFIELNPHDVYGYFCRGVAYSKLGNINKAIEDYSQAIDLHSNGALLYNKRGIAYDKINEQQLAIEDYSKAIRIKPKYAEAFYNRALAYGKLDQYQLAINDFNKVIQLKPAFCADAYHYRGVTYFLQGKDNLGYRDARKASSLGNSELLEWAKGADTAADLIGHLKLIISGNHHNNSK